MSEPIHILSLGAGVQSSTLALMAAAGEVTPMPHAAIFADTRNEEQRTYDWLEWLEKQLPFPVHRVSKGDLAKDFLKALSSEGGRCGQPPFFVKSLRDESAGVLWRKCTLDYKLQPIRRMVRELMRDHGASEVKQWIGISLDEAHRMKPSGVKYIENVYPLVDRHISRRDCLKWLQSRSIPEPPKSACTFCPYHNDAFWITMKRERAVEFERAVQKRQVTTLNGAKIFGKIFLHRSCLPLDQAVFDPHEGQTEFGFGNECEGMCGV